jgi:hypothetical protein
MTRVRRRTKTSMRMIHRDERGLVGKLAVVWLLVTVLLIVAAVDAGSIAFTTFKLSDTAVEAASDGAVEFSKGRNVEDTCKVARVTVESRQPELKIGKAFCEVDTDTGRVTITLRATARTILAGRLDMTKKYATIVHSETNGLSAV